MCAQSADKGNRFPTSAAVSARKRKYLLPMLLAYLMKETYRRLAHMHIHTHTHTHECYHVDAESAHTHTHSNTHSIPHNRTNNTCLHRARGKGNKIPIIIGATYNSVIRCVCVCVYICSERRNYNHTHTHTHAALVICYCNPSAFHASVRCCVDAVGIVVAVVPSAPKSILTIVITNCIVIFPVFNSLLLCNGVKANECA